MSPATSPLLDSILQGWKDYQEQLVVIIQPLTPEQLSIRVAPNLRSVGEIINHIIAGRAMWFSDVLNEGDVEITTMAQWDNQDEPMRTSAEYVHGLEVTWNLIQNALSRWTSTELTTPIILPWMGPEFPITRSFVIWHLLEHDLHHGGEVTHSLGLAGLLVKLPPPPPEH